MDKMYIIKLVDENRWYRYSLEHTTIYKEFATPVTGIELLVIFKQAQSNNIKIKTHKVETHGQHGTINKTA